MRLRHLLWRSVPVDCPPSPVTVISPSQMQHVMQMLDVGKLFPRALPGGSPASESDAVSWLLQHPPLLQKLSKVAGSSSVPADEAEMQTYCDTCILSLLL